TRLDVWLSMTRAPTYPGEIASECARTFSHNSLSIVANGFVSDTWPAYSSNNEVTSCTVASLLKRFVMGHSGSLPRRFCTEGLSCPVSTISRKPELLRKFRVPT